MGDNKIRVRFAPSPTGYLHLGSARTALFNWLYARFKKGIFVLRIEDTDKERSKKEYLDEILEDLKWLGVDWDEGPFFQSERTAIYLEFAHRLLEKELAYREEQAIIFKVEKSKEVRMTDVVHGEIVFNTDEIKDQVLIKSNGLPAYNFACVVDDLEMGITHIVRGDDHISNTPKQLLIYSALGCEPPIFAHMPLMMGKDGAKLSKRHGAVAVCEYKKEGFLPEALSNYLVLLGWSPPEGKEIITLKEASAHFDIKDLGNVQARFDADKLRWVNGEHIRRKELKALAELVINRYPIYNDVDKDYFLKVVQLYKERLHVLTDFEALTHSFFKDDYKEDEKARRKCEKYLQDEKTKSAILEMKGEFEKLDGFSKDSTEKVCRNIAERYNIKPAALIHPTRFAISGMSHGAGLFEMLEVLGKDKVVGRLERFLKVA